MYKFGRKGSERKRQKFAKSITKQLFEKAVHAAPDINIL